MIYKIISIVGVVILLYGLFCGIIDSITIQKNTILFIVVMFVGAVVMFIGFKFEKIPEQR